MTASAIVVLCTAPLAGRDEKPGAHELASTLVAESLCACVNVVPAVRSYFRWQGVVDTADELLLVIKTTAEAAVRLRERIVQLHPYDLPEVLELPIAGGLPGYLAWLVEAVPPRSP